MFTIHRRRRSSEVLRRSSRCKKRKIIKIKYKSKILYFAVSDAKWSWALQLRRQRRFVQRSLHFLINPHTLLSTAKRNLSFHDAQVCESVPISSCQRNEWVICFLWLCTRWIQWFLVFFFFFVRIFHLTVLCELLISVCEMCWTVLLYLNIELGFQSRFIE